MFTLYRVREPLGVECYRVRDSLCRYVRKITFNSSLEQVMVVMIGNGICLEIFHNSDRNGIKNEVMFANHIFTKTGGGERYQLFKC